MSVFCLYGYQRDGESQILLKSCFKHVIIIIFFTGIYQYFLLRSFKWKRQFYANKLSDRIFVGIQCPEHAGYQAIVWKMASILKMNTSAVKNHFGVLPIP